MPIKVHWGEKLEPHELLDEKVIHGTNAQQLYDLAIPALETAGLSVVESHSEPFVCWVCPERPYECALCKVDADCATMLRPQIIHLSCILSEETKP